jgi:hypothetical protein
MIKTRAVLFMGASLLLSSPSACLAGSDFVVLLENGERYLHDGIAPNKLLLSFTLPANVSKSGAAILKLETIDVDSEFDEVYVNPPTSVCNGVEADPNYSASIGYLDSHRRLDRALVLNDLIVFGARKLRSGINTLLLCARSSTGVGGQYGTNLDAFSVKNIVVRFRTN